MFDPLLSTLYVVVLHHIFNLVGFQTLSDFTCNNVTKIIPTSLSKALNEKKASIIKTREQLKDTSAQDEFAKWAKLKRSFDKQLAEYEILSKEQSRVKVYCSLFFNYGLPGFLWGVQIWLLVYYMAEPVFFVPEEWFGPLTSWLKFPFAPDGSCGVFYWWSAIKSVLSQATKALNAVKKSK